MSNPKMDRSGSVRPRKFSEAVRVRVVGEPPDRSSYLVIWNGSMGNLTRDEGWRTTGNYLLDHAPGHGNWIHPKDPGLANAPKPDSPYNSIARPVGRPVTSPNRTRRCVCGRKKRHDESQCSGCRLGKKQRKKAA